MVHESPASNGVALMKFHGMIDFKGEAVLIQKENAL